MPSSASTSAFGFSTSFTTTFTTDNNDGLPSYSEVIASAPLLDGTFSSSSFAGASTLKFEFDSSDSFGGYSFLVRDSVGCLQAKGEVDKKLNTKLRNVNGTEILRITNRNEPNVTEPNVQTFEVSHQYRSIGTVTVAADGPVSTCLRITQNTAYPEICVRSLKIGDFAIYRPNSMSSPICNIQMPYADIYNLEEYDVTIMFHRETGIDTEEQLLCTAAAIAFKVTMKRKTSTENSEGEACGYCLGIGVAILLILGLVLWIVHLEKGNCLRRKAGNYAGYADKEC